MRKHLISGVMSELHFLAFSSIEFVYSNEGDGKKRSHRSVAACLMFTVYTLIKQFDKCK